MVLSLGAISIIIGGLLALVHHLTEKPIEESRIKAKTAAMASILPAFDNMPSEESVKIALAPDDTLTVYPASENGKFVGAAVESYSMNGFSGRIDIMYGFDAEGKVTGYEVLRHAETPGLGAKMNEWFRDPVGNRSVIGSSGELAVSKDGGEIDAITAATISSRAFLDALNRARKAFESYISEK